MPSRTWIKIYCDKWLSGTLRQETPEFRGIWADLLSLAGSGRYGDVGEIKLADNVPLTNAQFAGILNISPETWLTTKERCLQTDRIRCNGAGIIQIVNWAKYQSDYERQKPHREAEFKNIRDSILTRDGFTCVHCNKHKDNLQVPGCSHHIDNDPSNNDEDNLITLCMSCHSHLLKKAVHPTKVVERLQQTAEFNKMVQQHSSREKEKEKEKERGGGPVPPSLSPPHPPPPIPSPTGGSGEQCDGNLVTPEGKPEPTPRATGILSRFTSAQRDELRTKFPGLDLEFEARKCEAWWAEGKRELKRPKVALMNWLQKTVKTGRSRPGAPRESHEYTRPEEAD